MFAFTGALVGHRITRRSALELDRWRKREETMRMLRWATELAVEPDDARADVGVALLGQLLDSPLVDVEDEVMVAAVTDLVARGRHARDDAEGEAG